MESEHLTLSRLRLWTHVPRHRLRFMASLCDACSEGGKQGGAIASVLFAYTLHGDADLSGLARQLLTSVCTTMMHLISQWIYQGQLDDAYREFFVASNPSARKDRLWYDKYTLRRQMIPQFITPAQANKVRLITCSACASLACHVQCAESQSALITITDSYFKTY